MSTHELAFNCQEARLAHYSDPKSKIKQDHYENSYRALFSAERMSNMLRAADNAVPGIRHRNDDKTFTPVIWDNLANPYRPTQKVA